jgi:hypothetical protein
MDILLIPMIQENQIIHHANPSNPKILLRKWMMKTEPSHYHFCLNHDPPTLRSRCRRSFSVGARRTSFGGIIGINMMVENLKIHPVNPSNPKILLYYQRIEIRCYKIKPRLRLCTKMAGIISQKNQTLAPKSTNLFSNNQEP